MTILSLIHAKEDSALIWSEIKWGKQNYSDLLLVLWW